MTTLIRSFEAPHWHQPVACATAAPGDECDGLQVCDICDVLICSDHQDEEQISECVHLRGVFHHVECMGGCSDCRDAEADSYYSSLAESRYDDALAAAEGRWLV